jgi:hypothetical protein
MVSISNIVNINQNSMFGYSTKSDTDIKILSNDSDILLHSIKNGNTYSKSKKLIKNSIQNDKLYYISNKANDYQELHKLITSKDFPEKMENNENFRLYILYHPLIIHHPEYTNITTKNKQIELDSIKNKMKDNTSFKIQQNIDYALEEDVSFEEDDYSEDI